MPTNKRGIRRKLTLAAASMAAAVGLVAGGAAVAPVEKAEAFSTFFYDANCPGTARYQQLVIRNYSGNHIQVDAKPLLSNTWKYLITTPAGVGGYVTYVPIQWSDIVAYRFVDPSRTGSLNWYYHVDCFY